MIFRKESGNPRLSSIDLKAVSVMGNTRPDFEFQEHFPYLEHQQHSPERLGEVQESQASFGSL